MAGGDPLRAQEIEEKLSRRWAERWLAWANAKSQAAERAAATRPAGAAAREAE